MKRQEYDHSKLEGTDADLETSLKEYGMAWIETDTEFLFYYGIKHEENECGDVDHVRFDFNSFCKKTDIKEMFDWVDWKSIYSYNGTNDTDFDDMPIPLKIRILFDYYGYENIFGSSYCEGLTYNEIVKEK